MDYLPITHAVLHHTRTSQGILIGTSRANPGKLVHSPAHLGETDRTAPLKQVYEALRSLEIDALVSIGGDDTLKSANKFMMMYQETLPPEAARIPVVHLRRRSITTIPESTSPLVYFTAAETLASEVRNLNHDAAAGQAYFLCETMGRSAGWLAYGAAIAGEACLVLSVEDIIGPLRQEEKRKDPETGEMKTHVVMDLDLVIERMVNTMVARDRAGKNYGVIVIAEGLAEYLSASYLEGIPRDDHGHISIASVNLGRMMSKMLSKAYEKRTGKPRKVTGMQLGYESRCAPPHAFDVMLGSQIGIGAYLALHEKKYNGVMISVGGQLELTYVPFERLVDPETLVTKVRYIHPTAISTD